MKKYTSLKLWVMPFGGTDSNLILGKEIEVFEKQHPDIKVDLYIIPWSQAWSKIMSAAKSKKLPDVFEIGNTWTKTLTAISALSDLTDGVNRTGLHYKYNAAAWETCQIAGLKKIYALPWTADVRMLFYRKDIFNKLGLKERNLENWGAFEETCKILTEHKGETGITGALGVGDIVDPGLVHDVAPWVWSSGGDFLTREGTQAGFDSEASLGGIRFYFDKINKGYAPLWDRKLPAYPAHNFFMENKYAMCIFGGFVAAAYLPGFFEDTPGRNPEAFEKFGVTFLPEGPAGRFSFFGGTNLATSNYSQHQEEAWQLLKFFTSKEFQIRFYKTIGIFPPGIEAIEDLFNKDIWPQKVLIESYKKFGRSYRQVDFWGSMEFMLGNLFGYFMNMIKARKFNEDFMVNEIKKCAADVNYILSL